MGIDADNGDFFARLQDEFQDFRQMVGPTLLILNPLYALCFALRGTVCLPPSLKAALLRRGGIGRHCQ